MRLKRKEAETMSQDENHLTEERLKQLIAESPEWAVGGLLSVYKNQTKDEQEIKGTKYKNNLGFGALDATILSSISEQFLKKGSITEGQLFYIRKALIQGTHTYTKQILCSGVEPVKTFTVIESAKTKAPIERKEAKLENGKISIYFSFPKGDSNFAKTLEKVRSLTNRTFIKDRGCWVTPLNIGTVDKLIEWGFDVDRAIIDWKDSVTIQVNYKDLVPEIEKKLNAIGMNSLYEYQKEGVAFIESRNGKALIADQPGLGKTLQALAFLAIHPELRPAVLVVPANVKLNWLKEIRKWMPNSTSAQVVSGRKPTALLKKGIIIINYDILKDHVRNLVKLEPKVVICDESHKIKEASAQRTKAARELIKRSGKFIPLSGTPITNKPAEFFTVLNLLRPDLFGVFRDFGRKYCGMSFNGFGWQYNGATNTEELHKLLNSTCMLRRLKKEVLKQLPDKMKIVVPIEIDNPDEYEKATLYLIEWLRQTEGSESAEKASQAEAIVKIEKLKQLAIKGKFKGVCEWIEDFIESGEKLVVFCTHRVVVTDLIAKFPNSVKVQGGDDIYKRQDAIEKFQRDPSISLFVGNIDASGEAIDGLQNVCSNCVFIEFPWNPAKFDQAADRIHRIGQDDTVTIWSLVAVGTIDEDMCELLDKKQVVLDQVLDGKNVVDESSMLTMLLDKIKERGR